MYQLFVTFETVQSTQLGKLTQTLNANRHCHKFMCSICNILMFCKVLSVVTDVRLSYCLVCVVTVCGVKLGL
jgi:hypothetical protein